MHLNALLLAKRKLHSLRRRFFLTDDAWLIQKMTQEALKHGANKLEYLLSGASAQHSCLTLHNPIIWLFWSQGLNNAPPIVRKCVEVWRKTNSDWDVRVLSYDDLKKNNILPGWVYDRELSIQALSDILRVQLLYKYGGVWADASVLCVHALTSWLPAAMGSGFFAFERPGPDRIISSWFLASAAETELIGAWRDQIYRYWNCNSHNLDYYWLHYMFPLALRRRSGARDIWHRATKLDAATALVLDYYIRGLLDNVLNGDSLRKCAPVQKLWRETTREQIERIGTLGFRF